MPGCLSAEFFWASLLLVMSIASCCESPEGSYLMMWWSNTCLYGRQIEGLVMGDDDMLF
jgi:hypothetical protein